MNYGAATQSVVTISLGQGQISGALMSFLDVFWSVVVFWQSFISFEF